MFYWIFKHWNPKFSTPDYNNFKKDARGKANTGSQNSILKILQINSIDSPSWKTTSIEAICST